MIQLFLWTSWLWRCVNPKQIINFFLLTGVSYPEQESGESEAIMQPQCDLRIHLSIQKLSFNYPSQNRPSIICPCSIQPKPEWNILWKVSSSSIKAPFWRSVHFWVYFSIFSLWGFSVFFFLGFNFWV